MAGPLALFATASVVSLGVAFTGAPADETVVARTTAADLRSAFADSAASPRPAQLREELVSRSGSRSGAEEKTKLERVTSRQAVAKAIKKADTKLWTTAALNLWTEPGEKAKKVGVLDEAEKVLVTGRSLYGRDEVVVDGKARWVTQGYLADEKPAAVVAPAEASCTNGTSVPSGVSPNIVAVHRAVCANFPSITTYGTFRSDGEHAQGIAVDIMVSPDLGWQVAEFVRENYADLGVNYIIYFRRIWSVERGNEGWRAMEDRGSVTANHEDHVHVTTY
ncbi:mucin-2 protein [Nocardioides ginkgobilobae]